MDLSECLNLADFEERAVERMSKMAYEYVASGAADELTIRWNRQAFDAIKLNPTVLNGIGQPDTRLSLFGQELSHPILIAPTAYHKLMHPEGELATARGAGAAAAVYVVSSFTTTPLAEITREATQPLWFQLYVRDDRELTKSLIQEAEDRGFRALCITVDTAVPGVRNRQEKGGFRLPDDVITHHMPGPLDEKKPLTWKDIEWINSFARTPVLLKGILNASDAEKAIQSGASGIIVSNHGGRNLDTVPATIDALPRVADQVNQRVPVLMDGGIRRGTDVLKAIALGASAVLVGKPVCFGLACAGAEGVTKVVEILRTELEIAMILTGRATISGIDHSVIWK
ncbi:alpha-hydroxy acid oxidase [Larkinella terrae]|uniref:Alpha-hydroxy-acid oxidizing protein n=1 Tax=Larkinella terrae TaxID=2025311 RepID=A0A7K0ETA4_9BACT|nr:alpha-hydroxy acid oxidase [Larkinella terrae]MRS64648.1 alpha-hydroxy-acid oxidizing protein [Larkinella terrae]